MKHNMSLMESVRADLNKLSEVTRFTDSNELSDALDQIEEHLQAAVQAADDLLRSGLGQNASGPFDDQLRSYFIPSIQNWINSAQQPGSLASLRAMASEEEYDDEDDELNEVSKSTLSSYIKKASGGVKGAASHALQAGLQADGPGRTASLKKSHKRIDGIERAVDRLSGRKVEENYSDHYDSDEYDEEREQPTDEGFFVVIASEENGVFVGAVVLDGGRFREVAIEGNPPYGWGSSKYMSYMSPDDIMQYMYSDYGNGAEVKGPFFDEHEAMDYAQQMM